MKTCILCGKETNGSTGAAGIFWPNICQPCKNAEDHALANTIKQQKVVIDQMLQAITLTPHKL